MRCSMDLNGVYQVGGKIYKDSSQSTYRQPGNQSPNTLEPTIKLLLGPLLQKLYQTNQHDFSRMGLQHYGRFRRPNIC